jgi:hypothetical protein
MSRPIRPRGHYVRELRKIDHLSAVAGLAEMPPAWRAQAIASLEALRELFVTADATTRAAVDEARIANAPACRTARRAAG